MGLTHACVIGSLGSLAHRELGKCRIASLGEREGICGRWWLSVMECVPNVKLIAKVNRIQCLVQLSKPLTGIFKVGRERSSGFCWLYWKRFRMEKLVLNEAETNWFFSVSDGKTDKIQENMRLCRGTCGVNAGRKFLFYIFYWGNNPRSESCPCWWCFSSPAMNRRHQKVSCCFRFRLSHIWTETWQGFFSGSNYSWLHG